MDQVRQSIDDVERKLTKIDAITSKGACKMTVKDLIKLARKGNCINSTIKKGIKIYDGVEPTNLEAEEIFLQMTRIVDLEEKQMTFAIQNKPIFDKLKVSGIVKANLEKSESSSLALAEILVAKSPAYLRPQAQELDKRAKRSFYGTMSVYCNAVGGEDQVDDKLDDSD